MFRLVALQGLFLAVLLLAFLPVGNAMRLQQQQGNTVSRGREDLEELETRLIMLAAATAHQSEHRFPNDTKGLKVVRGHDLKSTVERTFPNAICVPRTSLVATVPKSMGWSKHGFSWPKAEPGWEQCASVFDMAALAAYFSANTDEPTPSICVFNHAVVGLSGNVCDKTACLLGEDWEDGGAIPGATAIFAWKHGHRHPPVITNDLSCSFELGCSSDLASLPHRDLVYSVAQDHGWHFSRFMTGSLYRILLGLDVLYGVGRNASIHVSDTSQKWVIDTIKALGLGTERLVLGNLRAKALLYPEDTAINPLSSKLVTLSRWVLRKVIPGIFELESRARRPRILVVKRSPWVGRQRALLNHAELVNNLTQKFAPLGFEVKVFDDLKLPTQTEAWQLFATSAVVVGAHGGGLANLAAANPGGAVVELMAESSRQTSPCGVDTFQQLLVRLGLRHYSVRAPNMTVSTAATTARIPTIVQVVEQALQETPEGVDYVADPSHGEGNATEH